MRPAPGDTRFSALAAFGVWTGAFLAAVVGGSVVASATGHGDATFAERPLWLSFVAQLLFWIPLMAGTFVVARRLGSGDVRRDLGLRAKPIDLAGIPLGIATQLLFVPLLYQVLERFGLDTSDLDEDARLFTDKADDVLSAALVVLMAVVLAPIVEEVFFRGLLMRSLQARYDDLLALLVSAGFFGLVHLQGLQLPGLVLVGLIVGICAQRTGRLGMSILTHMAFNATAVLTLLGA